MDDQDNKMGSGVQSPAPVARSPLTAEDVALLRKGDVLRHKDGELCHIREVIDGWVYASDWREPVFSFTFIGRPDADGWMPWSGGENPVPGRKVNLRWLGTQSDDSAVWDADAQEWEKQGAAFDIIAFRLSRPASEQPVEAIGAGRRELLERLEAEVSDETMRALLSCKDVGSGRAHLARILAALSPASPARTPMGEGSAK